ncbi:amino acid dehydrogenase [Sinorhizobium meliloti]|nr:amino acid dehydrogenase [Sinorhizobium meliloti]MDX0222377.1 amino acid dehydrogenase [Sinorhizobium meliloti]
MVGITSAYQLAKAGYEVTVIDRQGGPALETSFANANGSLVRLLLAWAAPASRRRSSKGLFVEHAQLLLRRPRIDGAMLSWLVKMLSNCTSGRYGNQAAGLPADDPDHRCLEIYRHFRSVTSLAFGTLRTE